MSSVPEVTIEQPGGSDKLSITVVTAKRSTDLSSKLFELLEEESLKVLDFNRSPTNEKEVHSIQAKVLKPSQLDIDGLKSKLNSWAAE